MFTWCGMWKENGRKNSVQREPRNWMFVSCQGVTEQNDNIKRANEVNYVQQLSWYVTVTIQLSFRRCPISSVSKIHNNELYVSKAGSDSIFRWKGDGAPLIWVQCIYMLVITGSNWACFFSLYSLRRQTVTAAETSCLFLIAFLFYFILFYFILFYFSGC
jgi:hypothetical protein